MTRISAADAALAGALREQAVQAGQDAPRVRGADWRTAIVQTISSDGTVTTSDGITARRAATYLTPAAGDQIVLTQSGAGNWLAAGRLAPASTAGTWQPISLASGWTAWGSPYWTPAYRINGDFTVSLSGMARAPAGGLATPANVGTLPAGVPPTKARFTTEVGTGIFGAIDVNTSGVIQILDYSGNASWASLDIIHYRLL